MNRAFLVVGIPGIAISVAYVFVGWGWRAGLTAAFIGIALIALAAWSIRRKRREAV
jgi:LPXTG-motif cell wall-anchored protein